MTITTDRLLDITDSTVDMFFQYPGDFKLYAVYNKCLEHWPHAATICKFTLALSCIMIVAITPNVHGRNWVKFYMSSTTYVKNAIHIQVWSPQNTSINRSVGSPELTKVCHSLTKAGWTNVTIETEWLRCWHICRYCPCHKMLKWWIRMQPVAIYLSTSVSVT